MSDFWIFMIGVVGWVLVYAGADYKRENTLKIFTIDWFIQTIIIVCGVLIIIYAQR
jgi:hypothetical protein